MQVVRAASIYQVVKRIYPPGRERVLLGLVTLMSLLTAVVETVGVASILPFMALVIDPDALMRIDVIRETTVRMGITDIRGLTIFLGIGIVVIIVLGNALSALNIFAQQFFSARTLVRVTTDMFEEYLKLPYSFHLKRDVASIIKVMSSDTSSIVSGVINPLIVAIGRGFVALGIVTLLFIVDPILSTTVTLVLTLAYLVMFWGIRNSQRVLGERTNENNLLSGRTAMETLAGVKELIVLGRERYALGEYRQAYRQMNRAQALNASISSMPKFVLESIAFSGIVLITLLLIVQDQGNARSAVPIVALYGFSAYRLMPALQQIFSSAVSIRFYQPAVESFREDIEMLERSRVDRAIEDSTVHPEVHFRESIQLDNVSFKYPDSHRPALQDINLIIKPNESIGFVGRTGAGKTTLADMILGLYPPTDGEMRIDGVPMRGAAVRSWQRRVGFVSQHVFLRNASIAENIALGIPPDEIDRDALENAAERAQADEFISQLPNGLDSEIGASGVRLSGGQRQRLGIARALYHEPEVLVFDEATSALDGMTEDAVMDAIEALSGERTVILIAHRLRTVEACDRIVMLDAGRIVTIGPYKELIERSDEFRRFVGKRK